MTVEMPSYHHLVTSHSVRSQESECQYSAHFSFRFYLFLIMHNVWVCTCEYRYCGCQRHYPPSPPGARVTGSCEPPAIGAGNQTQDLLEYANLPLRKLREETCLICQRLRRYSLKWMRSSRQSQQHYNSSQTWAEPRNSGALGDRTVLKRG